MRCARTRGTRNGFVWTFESLLERLRLTLQAPRSDGEKIADSKLTPKGVLPYGTRHLDESAARLRVAWPGFKAVRSSYQLKWRHPDGSGQGEVVQRREGLGLHQAGQRPRRVRSLLADLWRRTSPSVRGRARRVRNQGGAEGSSGDQRDPPA